MSILFYIFLGSDQAREICISCILSRWSCPFSFWFCPPLPSESLVYFRSIQSRKRWPRKGVGYEANAVNRKDLSQNSLGYSILPETHNAQENANGQYKSQTANDTGEDVPGLLFLGQVLQPIGISISTSIFSIMIPTVERPPIFLNHMILSLIIITRSSSNSCYLITAFRK